MGAGAVPIPVSEQTAALDRLGSWGMQRPDVDADGYPIDDWDDDETSIVDLLSVGDPRPSCDWCPEPATWVRRGVRGCADHPINKLGWERL